MKRKSIKVFAALLAVLCLFSFTACAEQKELTGPEAFAADEIGKLMASFTEYQDVLDELMDQCQEEPFLYDSAEALKNAIGEMGALKDSEVTEVTETKGSYVIRGKASFEKGVMDFSSTVNVVESKVNRKTGEVTYGIQELEKGALKFDQVKTLGDKLGDAAINTLLGMGTVFIVLILISFIISLFKYVNSFESWLEKKKNAKKGVSTAEPEEETAETEEEIPDESDDLELVAVIAAAIAAYEGTSADGVRVRSIRKVASANKWKRG